MTVPQDITKLQSEVSAAVREHWKAFLFEGILLVVLGLAAMILPPLASLAVTIFLGWMFLISGSRRAGADVLGPANARLLVVAGFGGAGCSGRHCAVDQARAGRTHPHDRDWGVFPGRRRHHHHVRAGTSPRIVGTVELAAVRRRPGHPELPAMIIAGLPGSAEWAIGLLVGINLLFGGASLIGMALAGAQGLIASTSREWKRAPLVDRLSWPR